MRQVLANVIAITIVVLSVFAREGRADANQAPSEPLAIQQVSLFKNGLAFFTGQITCPPEAESFEVVLPVAPSHGTFWVSYPTDLAVGGIVAKQADAGQLIDAVTIPEILQANPDRKVQLTMGDKSVTGVIRYVARDRSTPAYDSSLVSSSLPYYRSPEQPRPGNLLIVETDAGEVSIDPSGISQVVFLDGKAERRFAGGGKSPVLHVQLKKPAPGVAMTVSFLAKGAAWAPSYRVDITDP
ncbi:MAG: hypothetical protein ACM3VT_02555, partial [Solirubrobacterales bacterium]